MKYHSYKSPTHPIHIDIQPVVSALKYGKKRIAQIRLQQICIKNNLMRWESLVVASLVRKACTKKSIPI